MKRLFSMIVLVAVLTVPIAVNAQNPVWRELSDSKLISIEGVGDTELVFFTFEGYGDGDENFIITAHDPSAKEGDFGLFPFLGKSFYKFVLKPAYKATKASGKTGGKAVKFFFVQIGHFLF